jgi:hypothetical protein
VSDQPEAEHAFDVHLSWRVMATRAVGCSSRNHLQIALVAAWTRYQQAKQRNLTGGAKRLRILGNEN